MPLHRSGQHWVRMGHDSHEHSCAASGHVSAQGPLSLGKWGPNGCQHGFLTGCLKSYCVRGTELLFAAHQLPGCMWRLPCAAAGLPGSPEVAAGASLPMESCSLEMSLAAW